MNGSDKIIFEKLNLLIEENLDNSAFSLDTLVKELGISRSQLHRIVKEQAQLSISLYIRKVKLQKAKELLITTELRISEVAYKVGIDSPQSFSKYFTEEFGINPSEYRKQNSREDIIEAPIVQFLKNEDVINENTLQLVQSVPQKSKIASRWIILGVMLTVMISIGTWLKISPSNLSYQEGSIAVLPFKNLGTAETNYFTVGIMEQIHSSLVVMDSLKVISKTSSGQYLNTTKTISEIGKELKVNYILEGTVLYLDNKVRITVELIRVNDSQAIWTDNYEGDRKDIFDYMASIAKEITKELNQKLSATLRKKLDKAPTKNMNAYNEFLQGKELIKTRTKEKINAGILKFDKAIALDSSFADAYAHKANAYYLLGDDNFIDSKISTKLAEQNVLIAIQLDADNGMAYATLAKIYQKQNKWKQANTSFKIALKYSPNDAQINYWYSLTLRSIGAFDKAISYSTKAVALDPLYPTILVGHIGNCSYAGKFDAAREAIEEGKPLFSDSYLYYWATAFYYINLKDYKAALKEFDKGDRLTKNVISFMTMIAYCQAKLGQKIPANIYLKSLPNIPDNYNSFAIVYAGLGDTELCIEYLQKGAEIGNLPNYIKVSPLFTFLHTDARFQEILQKIGLTNPDFITQ